jgi:hypothetical protein
MTQNVRRPSVFAKEVDEWVRKNPIPDELSVHLDAVLQNTAHTAFAAPVFDTVLAELDAGNPVLLQVLLWVNATDAHRESRFTS